MIVTTVDGADALVVSNHGGRQLDLTMALCGRTKLQDVDSSILLPGTYPTVRNAGLDFENETLPGQSNSSGSNAKCTAAKHIVGAP